MADLNQCDLICAILLFLDKQGVKSLSQELMNVVIVAATDIVDAVKAEAVNG